MRSGRPHAEIDPSWMDLSQWKFSAPWAKGAGRDRVARQTPWAGHRWVGGWTHCASWEDPPGTHIRNAPQDVGTFRGGQSMITWVGRRRRLHFLNQSLSWNVLQVFSFDCHNNPASCTLSIWSVGGNSVSEMLNNFPKVIWEEPGFIARSVGTLSHREVPSTPQFPLGA